jgi:hypothetical protein
MIIKKFNTFVKEDYSSEYEIEKPFLGDGDDLTTQEDESTMTDFGVDLENLLDDNFSDTEEEGEFNIETFLSKLPKEALEQIANGDLNVKDIACNILNTEGECCKDEYEEEEESCEYEEEPKFMDIESLSESLKFKNFKRRK